jgi:ABC-type microcin C transport system permease subunit YejE
LADGVDEGPVTVQVDDIERPLELRRHIDMLRENMRGYLALGLLLLLAIEVWFGLSEISKLAASDKPNNAKIVSDWLSSVVTGTIALLGAATGFYFGTKRGGSE